MKKEEKKDPKKVVSQENEEQMTLVQANQLIVNPFLFGVPTAEPLTNREAFEVVGDILSIVDPNDFKKEKKDTKKSKQ